MRSRHFSRLTACSLTCLHEMRSRLRPMDSARTALAAVLEVVDLILTAPAFKPHVDLPKMACMRRF